jgi:exonuclease SbcC
MIPLSLRLRNFMSYGEDVPPLDFSQITTACLTGDNGHGKSALLDAITWSLWGQTRAKNLDDVVRLGQEDAEVEFAFALEDAHYRVLRKRSLRTKAGQSSLDLQGFDAATNRYQSISGNSIRETEAKIVQLLHMNYDTFINSVFILQGRADEFTTRRPTERKRILGEILGLAVFDELEIRAKLHRGALDQEVKGLTQRLDELQHEVARREELATAVDAQQAALAQLHAEIEAGQERFEQLRQRQSALDLQSQSAQEARRRLQQVQHELAEVTQQVTVHRQRVVDYETTLQQESTITAGYELLQRLRKQERYEGAKAEQYTALNQRLISLQQVVTTAQHRLELDLQSSQQRLQETHKKLQECEALMHQGPRIAAAYEALQSARQQEAALAQALQQRYRLSQEKSQVERRMQQKRHVLELEQHGLVARQHDWEQKQAHLPTWQQQLGTLRQQLRDVEQQAKQLERVRSEGVAIKVQLDMTLPQTLQNLQEDMHQYQEKHQLLAIAGAHCPLCEKTLSDHERQRVMRKLTQEISACEGKIRELQRQQQHLQQQRQSLRTEYKQLEQRVEQRQALEQQYATVQVSLEEATRACEHLAAALEHLQHLEAQLASGSYASEELTQLQQLTAELDRLAYDPQEHEALKRTLADLAPVEVQQAQVLRAEEEAESLRQQQHELTERVALMQQTLQSKQYAVAEQHELHEVTASMARLDFQPAAYNLLRQQVQEQQYIERQHIELEAARHQLANERAILNALETRQQRYETDVITVEGELQRVMHELGALAQVQTDIAHTEALLANLRQREGETRLALGRSQSQYEHCLQREGELHDKRTQRQQAIAERTLYSDLTQMFGKNGIQAIIIENAIPELEDEANHILAQVSDNSMHLTLETQRDTRAGGVAETLDIKISDTLGTRNYELFSGGEAFRINVALRLALSKMLARRAGARLRTLVIDEGFGTQDSQGLERLVEIIKAIQGDFAKIIVITHLRDLKNAFDTHIEVKKDPLRGSMYQVL